MKINPTNLTNVIKHYNNQNENKYSCKDMHKKNTDKIEISQDAKYLSKITSSIEEVNLEKINEIKSKLNNGTYKIDSKKIAEKILDSIKGENGK